MSIMQVNREEPTPLADHWCCNCPFGTFTGTGVMCPFVVGSCCKVPGTLENPAPYMVTATDMRIEIGRRRLTDFQISAETVL